MNGKRSVFRRAMDCGPWGVYIGKEADSFANQTVAG